MSTAVTRSRPLGEGGPEVSVLGLGCNTFGLRIGLAETRDIVESDSTRRRMAAT